MKTHIKKIRVTEKTLAIIVGALFLVLVILFLTGCDTVGDDQYGMVFKAKGGEICGVIVTRVYNEQIDPFHHALQNPELYIVVKCRNCGKGWY